MVAALYVETDGTYFGVQGVDPWDVRRDARRYAGSYPVVAHPPCARWCRLAGMVETRYGHAIGDDGGTFYAALDAVRTYGGVLEHPAHSLAWDAYGLPKPASSGGWTLSLLDGGASCYVEQGHYGHVLRKPTWLYAHAPTLPDLKWGPGPGRLLPHRDAGLSASERKRLTIPTPPAFRDVLLDIAAAA